VRAVPELLLPSLGAGLGVPAERSSTCTGAGGVAGGGGSCAGTYGLASSSAPHRDRPASNRLYHRLRNMQSARRYMFGMRITVFDARDRRWHEGGPAAVAARRAASRAKFVPLGHRQHRFFQKLPLMLPFCAPVCAGAGARPARAC